jgi:septal ring factor EnvC (AmiA/AmiB activator)
MEENIRRKIQESEGVNAQLKHKIDDDERELQARIRRIQDLEAENAERERKLRDFARKSDLNEKEIAEIKAAMEKERRQSTVN